MHTKACRVIIVNDKLKETRTLKAKAFALLQEQRLDEAKAIFTQVSEIDHSDVEVWYTLSNINGILGKIEEAGNCCHRVLAMQPEHSEAHLNLGNILFYQEKYDEALLHYKTALRNNPALAARCNSNLGILCSTMGQLDEAISYFQEALKADPRNPAIHCNLGNLYTKIGRNDDAIPCYREALRLNPKSAAARSSLLFALCYRSDCDMETLFAEHMRWGEIHGRPATDLERHSNPPVLERRLRIGYVSADFRNHPIGIFIEQTLAHHDKSGFEIFCYSNQSVNDDLTVRLRRHADQWREIVGQPDELVAQSIRKDNIDILIDLAGHSSGNRLLTFALKPAPVQATWIGYIATTGLKAIDYILGDQFVTPPGDEHYYVEQVKRLPHSFLCFTPPDYPIEVTSLKAASGNGIKFGCFNNTAKLTTEVIRVWARLLQAIPDSRLLLKSQGFSDVITQNHYRSLFAKQGIQSDRLEFEGGSPRDEYLAAYREVDIGLDPFPFNGGTTTVEALWMGVPVISLRGDRFVGRMGASILNAVGLGEFVADDEDDYIGKAKALAADVPRLAELRNGLRAQLLNSPLCDGPGFTRDLESVYRTMWKEWCHPRGVNRR